MQPGILCQAFLADGKLAQFGIFSRANFQINAEYCLNFSIFLYSLTIFLIAENDNLNLRNFETRNKISNIGLKRSKDPITAPKR